jgi:lipopolysaccharide export LptBFGC system permease protein LptF
VPVLYEFPAPTRTGNVRGMDIILIIFVVLIVLSLTGWYGHRASWDPITLLIVLLLVFVLFGGGGYWYHSHFVVVH